MEIPPDVLQRLPSEPGALNRELLTDLVCGLYADWKVNSHVAARWLGITRLNFWEELGRRQIPRQISAEMIEEDASLADRQ